MKHIIPTIFGIWLSSISFSAETKPFPPEGLRLWLMADAGITTENNSKEGGSETDVAQWTDQSAAGIELTPAYKSTKTRPSLLRKVPEIGEKPALQFSGKGGSNFEITDALIGRFKTSFDLNRGTVFLVTSMPFIPIISPMTLSATADSKTGRGGLGIRRGGKSDSWFCVHYGGPGNGKKIQSQESKLDSKFHILTVRFDKHKSELEMIVDGRQTGTKLRDESTLPLDPINFIQVGGHGILDPPGDPGAEWFFNGLIAEIVVFDSILGNDPSKGAYGAVGNYLQRKYGISGNFSGTDSK